jgi:hypothetical protein
LQRQTFSPGRPVPVEAIHSDLLNIDPPKREFAHGSMSRLRRNHGQRA